MKNIKLLIEYDGTNYAGWQNQDNAITVQEKLEYALREVTNEDIKLIGSGRTDAGVHALGQVANFVTNATIPADKYKYILNNVLPDDIAIIKSEEVDMSFHSRFSAKKKRYKYVIYTRKMPSPIHRNYSFHYKHDLDLDKMKKASKYFIGRHDFSSFKGRKSIVKSNIRTIYEIEIEETGDFIEITFKGDSFLKYMIRIIVGTLINVGIGKTTIDEIPYIISSKNRDKAGKTAPPQGLFLEKVYYE